MATKDESQRNDFGINPEVLHGSLDRPHSTLSEWQFFSDCTPYLYLLGAFAAVFATLYVTDWFWVLPHSLLLSAVVLHILHAGIRKYTKTRK